MTSCSRTRAGIVVVAVAVVAVMLPARMDAGASQRATAPRLRESRLPAQMPEAFGGGEVVLEVTVDPRGAVARIDGVRVTPPYAELVADSAALWQFDPATVVIDGRSERIAAQVLVVALFRPPSFWSWWEVSPAPKTKLVAQLKPRPAAMVSRIGSTMWVSCHRRTYRIF